MPPCPGPGYPPSHNGQTGPDLGIFDFIPCGEHLSGNYA
jgi:hypothetical protein